MRVVLLGAGWIARKIYIPALLQSTHVTEIAVVDPACEPNFDSPKVRFRSLAEATADRADFAFVLSPNHLHHDHLLCALGFAATVFAEKPICTRCEQIGTMREALKQSDASVRVSAPFRFRRDLREMKTILQSGELGLIQGTEVRWLKKHGVPGSPWFVSQNDAGGGALIDMGPHLLDLFHWVFGPKTAGACASSMVPLDRSDSEVFAKWHMGSPIVESALGNVEAAAYSQLTFDQHFLRLDVAWVSPVEADVAEFRFIGTKGCLEVRTALGFSTETLYADTTFKMIVGDTLREWRREIGDRTSVFIESVKNLVAGCEDDFPTGFDGLEVMDQIHQIYCSAGWSK